MSVQQVLDIPWLFMIIGMIDAPSVDFKSKKENKKVPKTADEEMIAFGSIF